MGDGHKISPNNTYILDEDLLDEMDSIELTGLLSELSEQLSVSEDDPTLDEKITVAPDDADDADETESAESPDSDGS